MTTVNLPSKMYHIIKKSFQKRASVIPGFSFFAFGDYRLTGSPRCANTDPSSWLKKILTIIILYYIIFVKGGEHMKQDIRLQVLLNDDELEMFNEITEYYNNLYGFALTRSDILRFIIKKEYNWQHGIEFVVSNKTDSSLNNSLTNT